MSILKRAIPLLLCVVMLAFVLVACDTDSSEETPSGTTSHTHTPAAAVQENYVDSTCTQTGSYDEVVYCSACHEEISRTQKTVDKKAHDFNRKATASTYLKDEATCTESAVYFYSCACGEKGTTTFTAGEPNGHNYGTWITEVSATCEGEGTLGHYHCDACGKDFDADKNVLTSLVIPANGHDHDAVVTAPTCTTKGYTTYTCHCGDTYTDDEIAANGHSYDEWIVTKDPTETEKGEKRRDCKNCDHFETDVVAELAHDHSRHGVTILEAVAPTCTATGLTEGKKCSGCGEILVAQQTVPANGHSYGEWTQTLAPTCTEKGSERRDCDDCDHYETRELSAKGHTNKDAVVENMIDATCTAGGSYDSVIYCSVCNGEVSREAKTIGKLGHNYSTKWTVDLEPTCTEKGSKSHHCTRCSGKADVTEIAALGHTEVTDAAVDATCTATGLTEGTHCSVCNEVLVAQETIAATGHDHEAVVTAPTCTAKGYTTYTCDCGDTYTANETAALGHTEVIDAAVAATCTTSGKTAGKHCSVCKAVLIAQETIPATGHHHEAVVTAPTCTAKGYTTYTCDCGDTYTANETAALGHTEVTDAAVAATCTTSGKTAGKHCSVCNEVLVAQETIAATGHDHEAVVTAPTCTATGYTTYTCDCGDSYVADYVAATGHSFSTAWEQNDTHHWHKAICGHTSEISDKGEHAFGNDLICDTCQFEKEEDKISFKTLQANGTNVYGKVSNTTTTFSFLTEVTKSGKATFDVFRDLECSDIIRSKTASLEVGDNTFYILEYVDGEVNALYTVTVRRKPMYTVTFDAKGGTAVESQTVEEDALATLPETTKTGYTFAGWSYDFATPITKDTAITASWTANEYTITYDVNGGDALESNTQTATYDSDYTLAVPTRKGYTFAGWYHGETPFENGTWTLTDGITLTAKWNIITYHISYNLDGGSAENEVTYTVEDEITLTNPTRTGYTFAGWTVEGQDEPVMSVTITKGTIGDKSYTAHWTANTYTITYDVNGGDALESNTQTVTYGVAYTLAVPTRTGYAFAGWYHGETSFKNGTWTRIEGITLTAEWEIITYDISYDLDGGTTENDVTYTVEDEITLTAPTRAGYTFVGWTFEGQEEPVVSVTIAKGTIGDLSYTANWTANTYTITYDVNGGDALESNTQTVIYDATYMLAIPTRTGYAFKGWYNGERKVENGNWTVAEGVMLTAEWEIVTYNIFYKLSGGKTTNSTTYTVENEITLTAPTRAGYSFVGWTFEGQDEPIMSVTIAKGTIGDLSYTANWTANTYTITYVTNGGNEISPQTLKCGDELPTAVRNGYTFGGWFSDVDLMSKVTTVPAENATLYAYWAEENKPSDFSYSGTESITITDYIANDKTICIPSYIGGKSVTCIGSDAFRDCSSLTRITIPDSVTSIGSSAFRGCSSLTSITLPFVGASPSATGYQSHFGYIFGYNRSTSSSGSYHRFDTGYYYTYYIPTTLKSVEIMGVTSIGGYAFHGCNDLTSITIPDSVTSIGSSAFFGCSGLTSITIPDSITSIGENAFSSCSSLKSVHITNLSKWCAIGFGSSSANPLYYAGNLYLNGNLITELTIPNDVTSIGFCAFYNCSSLTRITIPDSATSIGRYAFSGCSSLASITIPDSMTSIGYMAFNGCNSLTYTTYDNGKYLGNTTNPYVVLIDVVDTSVTSFSIPNTTKIIYASAFSGCSSLTSIAISNSVTNIGYYAFSGCSSLTSVHVTDIVQWCAIEFGDSTANPLYYAKKLYLNGTLLAELVIPDGVTNIGSYTFYNCDSLTSITIPDTVTNIGNSAFNGCSSLIYTTYNNGKYLGNCTNPYVVLIDVVDKSVTSFSLPNTTKIIYGSAFKGCSSLTSITIPDSVTSIGVSAFYGCSSLTSIEIPNSVTSIGGSAFSGCSSLTIITIPDSVTSIGSNAFYGCSLTIFCQASSRPSGWVSSWNDSNRPVVWGYIGEEYTYMFESNGGSAVDNIVSSVTVILPTPEREGYYFCGWYDNEALEGAAVTSPYYSATNHTLYAKWMTEEEWCDGTGFERAISMELGRNYSAATTTEGQKVYYSFTATESRSYTFYSNGYYDTYGYLYDSNQSYLTYNDDGGSGSNFSITRTLTEGETYYLMVELCSLTGRFTVCVH